MRSFKQKYQCEEACNIKLKICREVPSYPEAQLIDCKVVTNEEKFCPTISYATAGHASDDMSEHGTDTDELRNGEYDQDASDHNRDRSDVSEQNERFECDLSISLLDFGEPSYDR